MTRVPPETEIDESEIDEAIDQSIEDMIDAFERGWTPELVETWRTLLATHGLTNNLDAVVELFRVDICRRHSRRMALAPADYLQLCPALQLDTERAPQLAYEDFRMCQKNRLGCSLDRWQSLPGVESQPWWQDASRNLASFNADVLDHSQKPSPQESRSPAESSLKPGSAQQTPANQPFRELGFELVQLLGQGAFSRVYLATQTTLSNRYVVLKVVDRHLDEPQFLARLQHTNIIPIFSFHRSGAASILCMPYLGAVTLADCIERRRTDDSAAAGLSFVETLRQAQDVTRFSSLQHSIALNANSSKQTAPLDSDAAMLDRTGLTTTDLLERLGLLSRSELALWVFQRLAAALVHSHERGIIHGDLKPANVLVRYDGEPALLDFNLAKAIDQNDNGFTGGTLAYMSPEQLRSFLTGHQVESMNRLATSGDIYGFGCILYEFLTGSLPYPASRSRASIDIQHALTKRQSKLLWPVEDDSSPGLRRIVERCLAYSVSDRYQTTVELYEDLRCESEDLPLRHAGEPSWRTRLRKWARRHPRLASAGSVAALAGLLTVVLALFAWQTVKSNRALEANANWLQFQRESDLALAHLLEPTTAQLPDSIQRAENCLQLFLAGDVAAWQTAARWQYLDDVKQQAVLNRMTDLMLRVATAEIKLKRDMTTAQGESAVPQMDVNPDALSLLQTRPFCDVAPVSLARLMASASVDVHSHARPLPDLSYQNPVDCFAESLYRLSRNQLEDAQRLLRPELLRVIDPFSYWIALGRIQHEAGELKSAEASFSLAIEQLRESAVGYYYRGLCRLKMRHQQASLSALTDLEQAIVLDSQNRSYRMARALILESLGQFDEAIQEVNLVNHMPGSSIQPRLILSRLYKKVGRPAGAQQQRVLARQGLPENTEDWIARALAKLPDAPAEALQDLHVALERDSRSIEVLQNQAHVLSEYLQQPEQAIDVLDQVLEMEPNFERARMGRSVLNARLGRQEAALNDLEQAQRSAASLSGSSLYQAACVHSLLAGRHRAVSPNEGESTTGPREMNNKSESAAGRSGEMQVPSDVHAREALKYLARSLARGYGAELMASDPDLAAIRTYPEFQGFVRMHQLATSPLIPTW